MSRWGIRGVDSGWLEAELLNMGMHDAVDRPLCPPHRYRIEEPTGPRVRGVCGICGAERTYNSGSQFEGTFWRNSKDQRYLP